MNRTIDISHCSKRVWIITRETFGALKRMNDVNQRSNNRRCNQGLHIIEKDMDETQLENMLKNICET
jgi:hypothetical protein